MRQHEGARQPPVESEVYFPERSLKFLYTDRKLTVTSQFKEIAKIKKATNLFGGTSNPPKRLVVSFLSKICALQITERTWDSLLPYVNRNAKKKRGRGSGAKKGVIIWRYRN
jgi:hypothetical protein